MWFPVVVFTFFLTLTKSHAHFNFFISQEEVLKLLGINGELFYVSKGVVNTYALSFVVLIPASVSDMHFSWQSLSNYSLPYVLSVKYVGNDEDALLPPQMNISSTGLIPTSVQTFRVRLMCTGLKTHETEVHVQLHVSSDRQRNVTTLNFRRNKICIQGYTGNSFRNDSIRLDPESLENATASLYVAVACAVAMISLVVVTTSAVCITNKKVRSQESNYMTAIYDNNPHVFLRLGGSAMRRTSSAGSGSYATIASIQKSPPSPSPYATSDACRVSHYASSQIMLISQVVLQDPRLVDPTNRLRCLSVPHSTINLGSVAEDGIFGQVLHGFFRQETVVIKTTKVAASKRQVSLFLCEGTMMYGLEHKNILPILGVNLDNPKQPLLIYPYTNRGNLKRFLVKCRQREDKQFALSTQNLVDMAIQILLGLMYLHSQCICYKDLATRNCVVDEKLHVKISDNCLSRDLFPNDYFCLDDNESRPVKWLALESLLHKQFTAASDVWSLGVVLWELTTLAQQPFSEIDPFEMGTYLRNGYRLSQPVGCPDELFTVMCYCWLANPTERPQLPQLLAFLQDFYSALCRFI